MHSRAAFSDSWPYFWCGQVILPLTPATVAVGGQTVIWLAPTSSLADFLATSLGGFGLAEPFPLGAAASLSAASLAVVRFCAAVGALGAGRLSPVAARPGAPEPITLVSPLFASRDAWSCAARSPGLGVFPPGFLAAPRVFLAAGALVVLSLVVMS